MQSIQLHPLSLLTGIGLALVAFVAMGQSPQPISPSTSSNRTLEFFARPRDFVQVDEGSTFVVPSGKLFVPTAIGARPPMMNSQTYELVSLVVDGEVQLSSWKAILSPDNAAAGNGTSMRGIPGGYAVPGDAAVEVRDLTPSVQDARLWGYLVDA
ncbi:MAG: hypothetical protein IT454_15410 [Planctomycetes bacterium]|nr:hypothetical protein [Planctomycetota bacterium]